MFSFLKHFRKCRQYCFTGLLKERGSAKEMATTIIVWKNGDMRLSVANGSEKTLRGVQRDHSFFMF